MEKVYTLKELNEMREATIEAAFDAISSQMGRNNSYTANELSAMCGGLLSKHSIAGRARHGWYMKGWTIQQNDIRITGGRKQLLAELDAEGNIVRKFYARLPESRVYNYKLVRGSSW